MTASELVQLIVRRELLDWPADCNMELNLLLLSDNWLGGRFAPLGHDAWEAYLAYLKAGRKTDALMELRSATRKALLDAIDRAIREAK